MEPGRESTSFPVFFMKSKFPFLLILFLPFLVLSCRNSHPIDKKEALNSLKVLNGDIIRYINKVSERPGFKALGFLLKQPSAHLPFRSDTSHSTGSVNGFSFNGQKGIYSWDTVSRMFLKDKDTSVILLRFPMPGAPASLCRFYLYKFETGSTRKRPGFPVEIRAKLFIGNKEKLSISHQARISESMISWMSSELKSDSSELLFNMARKGSFADKSGKVNASLRLFEGSKEILRSKLDLDIDYHPPLSYSVRHISIEQKLFATELSGTIDYGSISPTSDQYDLEFNKHTDIEVINTEDRGIIGNIVLSPAGDNGRFDYFIRFSDGSESRLTDQFNVLRKLFERQSLKNSNSL